MSEKIISLVEKYMRHHLTPNPYTQASSAKILESSDVSNVLGRPPASCNMTWQQIWRKRPWKFEEDQTVSTSIKIHDSRMQTAEPRNNNFSGEQVRKVNVYSSTFK
jgi:hypothetical protein